MKMNEPTESIGPNEQSGDNAIVSPSFDYRLNKLIVAFDRIHFWQTGRGFPIDLNSSRHLEQFCLGELIRAELGWSPEIFVEHINHQINGNRRNYGHLRPRDLCSGHATELLLSKQNATSSISNYAEQNENYLPEVPDPSFDEEIFNDLNVSSEGGAP